MVATSGETELCGSRYLQDDGATPLYVASQEGHDAVVTALLASGAAVNQARTVGVMCVEHGKSFCSVSCTFALLRYLWHVVVVGYPE